MNSSSDPTLSTRKGSVLTSARALERPTTSPNAKNNQSFGVSSPTDTPRTRWRRYTVPGSSRHPTSATASGDKKKN
jgi:hypothetical protein